MADWAAQVRAAGQTPVVLDVREDFEIEASAVDAQATQQGFEMLYMPMWQIPQRLNDLPDEDAPLAILCHHGQRSVMVAHFLADHGYENLYNITGGIDNWSRFDPAVPRYVK